MVYQESTVNNNLVDGTDGFMRDAIIALHRATTVSQEDIRRSAVTSLLDLVTDHTLLIIQTWLDQFTRTNGGSAPAEYTAIDRVRLLTTLNVLFEKIMTTPSSCGQVIFDTSNSAFQSALDRVISMAAEEMTRHFEVTEEVQKPCSEILVNMCRSIKTNDVKRSHLEKVMDVLMTKFENPTGAKPNNQAPHYYVIATLSAISVVNPIDVVPFYIKKSILSSVLANMRTIKKDNLRFVFATALSRFSEAVLDYLNADSFTDTGSYTREDFSNELDQAHETLFNSWLNSSSLNSNGQTKYAVMEALGQMSPLLSDERISKHMTPVISLLITLYKRSGIEPYHVTQCISTILKAIVERDSQILDSIVEQLLTALFVQVCQFSYDSSTTKGEDKQAKILVDLKRRNHYEVLRCYDVLVQSHDGKLINGLINRCNSSDENVRLAGLTVIKHLMNSSGQIFEPKLPDILSMLHLRLKVETSNRVRKMMAQLVAIFGRLGYLETEDERSVDFIEFVVKLCGLPESKDGEFNR